jgi:Peptidase family M28
VINPRLYRIGFLPAIVALVVVMFSVQAQPEPLERPTTPGVFEAGPAARSARAIAELAPERPPGSEGDAAVADFVSQRFSEIQGGEISEQTVESSFEGVDVELRNVILTLPGESERQVMLLTHRDSPAGPGYASSAAATATLVEIAESFGGSRHAKTLVFVSTSGGTDGASGARAFVEDYPERNLIDGAIVVQQPGASTPSPPHVLPWSIDDRSTSIQLTLTAYDAVTEQTDIEERREGLYGSLMRLALPSGLGEQSVVIAEDLDGVGISADGERPLPIDEDGPDSLSAPALGDYGRATLSLLITLDQSIEPLVHGPGTYVTIGDNMIPGWSIALFAICLLLPAALASVDATARSWRRGEGRPRDLGWVATRSFPFLAALLLAYVLALTGLAPRPKFPYDPGRYEIGWRAVIVIFCLLVAFALVWTAIRALRVPRGSGREGLAAATGAVLSAAVAMTWVINPFLALLLVPAAHVWPAAIGTGGTARRVGIAVAVAIALVPSLLGISNLAARLEVGAAMPWQMLLMVTGGQIGFGLALLLCLIAGGLVAMIATALASDTPPRAPRLAARRPGQGPAPMDGR